MTEQKVEIIRSSRKTLSVQIKNDGTVVVRAPRRLPMEEIRRFLRDKSDWIGAHLARVKEANCRAAESPLSAEDLRELVQRAKETIPERVRKYAEQMGVSYGRITIRSQKTRWGSCSREGNLNFNCLLMLAPPEILDYVVVHELSHRRHMDHSERFWKEVASVLPDYRIRAAWLRENGPVLLARMRIGEE